MTVYNLYQPYAKTILTYLEYLPFKKKKNVCLFTYLNTAKKRNLSNDNLNYRQNGCAWKCSTVMSRFYSNIVVLYRYARISRFGGKRVYSKIYHFQLFITV